MLLLDLMTITSAAIKSSAAIKLHAQALVKLLWFSYGLLMIEDFEF